MLKAATLSPHSEATSPVQPLHVIAYAFFQRKPWLVAKRAPRVCEIRLREILIMRVRIIDVVGLKICSQTFV